MKTCVRLWLVLILLVALFPPWKGRPTSQMSGLQDVGHAFLLSPPAQVTIAAPDWVAGMRPETKSVSVADTEINLPFRFEARVIVAILAGLHLSFFSFPTADKTEKAI